MMWALCLALALSALTLGPMYLLREAPRAGSLEEFLRPSPGGSREILAVVHVVFLLGMLTYAMFSAARRVVGRMAGVAAAVGIWEVLLAVAAVFVAGQARFALSNMTVAALGLLLLLGGMGLTLERVVERLRSPKTPVILIFAVAGLAGVVAFGLIGAVSARRYARVDCTRLGLYSVPKSTKQFLAGLDKEVRITTLFVTRKPEHAALKRAVTDVLDEYAHRSRRITVGHIDYVRERRASTELARRLAGPQIALEENAVIFECPETGRAMKVAAHEMYRMADPAHTGAEIAAEQRHREAQERFRFIGDSIFHEALSVVTTDKAIKLYFVVGHGEKPGAVGPKPKRSSYRRAVDHEKELRVYEDLRALLSTELFQQALRRRYCRIEELDLDRVDKDGGIPEDCDVLVIAGPCRYTAHMWGATPSPAPGRRLGKPFMKPFSPEHATLVRRYLDRGGRRGRALIMVDPVGPEYELYSRALLGLLGRQYGVDANVRRHVMEQVPRTHRDPYGREVIEYVPARAFVTEGAEGTRSSDGRRTVHPSIRSLRRRSTATMLAAELTTTPRRGLRHVPLLTTSENGWLHPFTDTRPDPQAQEKARRVLALAVEKEDTGEPVMVVLGSSNMFVDTMLRRPGLWDNAKLGQSLLSWLSGAAAARGAGFEPRPTEVTYGKISTPVLQAARFISVFVIPSLFIVVGVVVWLGRRE